MTSFVRNIRTKNCRNLIIGFQVTVENVGDVFLTHSVYNISQTVSKQYNPKSCDHTVKNSEQTSVHNLQTPQILKTSNNGHRYWA